MKKIIVLLSTLILTLGMSNTPTFAEASSEKHLVIDGRHVTSYLDNSNGGERYSYNVKGRTYLPLRDIVQFLGGEIDFDPATKNVSIIGTNVKTGKPASFLGKLNSNEIAVDGVTTQLDTNPDIKITTINYQTSVPLRTISEVFGYEVKFDAQNQIIFLTNPNHEPEPLNIAPEPRYTKGMDFKDIEKIVDDNVVFHGNMGGAYVALSDKVSQYKAPLGDYLIYTGYTIGDPGALALYSGYNQQLLTHIKEVLSYLTKDYEEVYETYLTALLNGEIGSENRLNSGQKYGLTEKPGHNSSGNVITQLHPTEYITTSDGVRVVFADGNIYIR